MAKKRGWTDDELQDFARLWVDGMPIHDMAHRFRISDRGVKDLRQRLNLPTRRAIELAKHRKPEPVVIPSFRHRSLISFLPDSPFLQKRFELEVKKARAMRGMVI